jgi:hypothetical protein
MHVYLFVLNRYEIPSRRTLERKFQSKKIEVEARVKEEIKSCEHVAITHDSWTSLNTESYSMVTVHYMDGKWNIKFVVLEKRKMEGSHTSENISKGLMESKRNGDNLTVLRLLTMPQANVKLLLF